MKDKISNDTIEKWLKGWSLSRELPLPVVYKSGFKVEVGKEEQKIRYVFSELNNDFIELSKQIDEPWVYLKVCASPEEVKNQISGRWEIQPLGYMMSCSHLMNIPDIILHNDYQLEYETYNSTFVVKITTKNGELASIGRVVLVDDLAVYDRIFTERNHQRKGLATFLMKELEKIALSKGIVNHFLVSTEAGKPLYQSLGWKTESLYTSIVIPGILE
jgi:GNAT superfamily N-acetyltransferase